MFFSFKPSTPDEYERGQRVFRRSFLVFFVVFLIAAGFFVGYERGRSSALASFSQTQTLSPDDAIIINKESQDQTIDFALFWKVWGLLKDMYVDKSSLDAHELFYGAIRGMLAATGDPYTTFFSPKDNQEFKEDISGTFDGIGAEMGMKDGVITIIAPLDGAPSEKAGLMAGDKIVKIDGESSSNLSIDEAVKRIRGPKGTKVTLTVFRSGEQETRDITVTRDTVLVKSVRFEMKDDGMALIRISRFGDDTEKEFKDAVDQAIQQHARGLIIDLRNNPGGYLESAVNMGSLMIPSGKTIVIEEDGSGNRTPTMAKGGDVLSKIPTVVIINAGSASASEILAGALREDRDNVTLVGERSFGKGSVQQLIPTSKDTSVKITVAKWLTPQGNQIHGIGIAPDEEIKLTADDVANERDPQLEKAMSILHDTIGN